MSSLPVSVFVVRETIREVRYLRNPPTSGKSGGKEPVNWQPLQAQRHIGVLERTHPQEFAEFVRLAQLVDEGEAAAAAAAIHHGYDLVIDDRKARRIIGSSAGLIWSLDLVHDWCQETHIGSDEIGVILANIRRRATYYPHRLHPRLQWWEDHFIPD